MTHKKYMIIVFKMNGVVSRRIFRDNGVMEMLNEYQKRHGILDSAEIYKYRNDIKDWKYLCTIKVDRGLL